MDMRDTRPSQSNFFSHFHAVFHKKVKKRLVSPPVVGAPLGNPDPPLNLMLTLIISPDFSKPLNETLSKSWEITCKLASV